MYGLCRSLRLVSQPSVRVIIEFNMGVIALLLSRASAGQLHAMISVNKIKNQSRFEDDDL